MGGPDPDPSFKSFNVSNPLDKNRSSGNFGYTKGFKGGREATGARNYRKRKGVVHTLLNPKKKKNMTIRSQTSSFLTNGSNQQGLKHAKMAKMISNKARRGSRDPTKGRSSSVKQENLGKNKYKGPSRPRAEELRHIEEGATQQVQFSERNSKSNSNAEELAGQADARGPKNVKARKGIENNKMGEECSSPNEARKKTRKNCGERTNTQTPMRAFGKKTE